MIKVFFILITKLCKKVKEAVVQQFLYFCGYEIIQHRYKKQLLYDKVLKVKKKKVNIF